MANQDKKTQESAKKTSSSFDDVARVVGKSIPIFGKMTDEISSIGKAFQTLSNTGNVFNNDMLSLRVAAANARLSLEEYTDVLKENGKYFSGLGGSVSKGSQVFGDFSKAFFESNITDHLRQIGYTSKDLNELLSLQITMQKSYTDTSVEGQMRTAKAAAELGVELDLIARLTGQTRKEQEEALKKAAVDGQIEAKIRLMAAGDPEKAREIKEKFAQEYIKAEAMGQGQLFKEYFASQTATTKEAQLSLGIFGDAARKTAESAKLLGEGQTALASESMKQAQVANMENQKNVALNTIAATGVGDAAKLIIKNIEKNDTAYQGLQKFMEKTNDVREAMEAQRQAIVKEQAAREPLTEILVTTTRTIEDVRAGLISTAGRILQNSGERDAKGRPTGVMGQLQDVARTVPGGDKGKSIDELAKQYADKKGKDADNIGAIIPAELEKAGFFKAVKGIDQGISGLATKIGEYIPKLQKTLDEIAALRKEEVKPKAKEESQTQPPPPKREGGSIGEAGMLFENWGKGTLAELHGMEAVVRPDQMMNMAKGLSQEGAGVAFNQMKSVLAGQDKTSKGIDLTKISNDIKTTISKVEVQNWPKNLISKVEVKGPSEAKPTDKPTETKPATTTKAPETKPTTAKETTVESKKPLSNAEKIKKQDAELEEHFKKIGAEKGETAERIARQEYATEKKRNDELQKWRDEELKVKIAGIREGPAAEQKMRDLVEKSRTESAQNRLLSEIAPTTPKTNVSKTQTQEVIVNGKQVDPNSKEGQAAIKQLETTRSNIESSMKGLTDLTRTNLQEISKEIKNNQKTSVSIDGKPVDPNSKEGQAAIKQMESMKLNIENSMSNMLNLTKTAVQDPARTNLQDSSRLNLQEIFKEVKNNQKTTVTIDGKSVDPNSKEGQAAIKQLETTRSNIESSMKGLTDLTRTNLQEISKETKKNQETSVSIDGKPFDPDSKEGQAVIREMEASKARLEQTMNSLMTGVVYKKTDLIEKATSGGSVTEGKQFKTDDAKAADQELSKVLGQHMSKQRELYAQMKEQLGPDAKFSDVRRAVKESQQGKDLDNEFRPQVEALRKRIEEGTTWEVNKRAETNESIKKISTEQSQIVTGFKTKELDDVKKSGQEAINLAQENNKFKIKVEQDYNDHWTKSRDEAAQKITDLEKKAATETLTKREQNELAFQKNIKAQADQEVAISAANLEDYKKQGQQLTSAEQTKNVVAENIPIQGIQEKSVASPQQVDPGQFVLKSYVDNATEKRNVNKEGLNEILSLNQQEREAKKQKYQEEYDLANKGFKEREKQLLAIEERYEAEGKKGQEKHDEEFKRLEAEEKAYVERRNKASEQLGYFREVDETKRKMEDQGYNFEKELQTRKQALSKDTAEVIKKDMKDALPLQEVKSLGEAYKGVEYPQPKEFESNLAKASESLDEHGKKTLQFVANDNEAMLETRKKNAKRIIESEEENIAERTARVQELEKKANEQGLTNREKNRLEEEKREIAKSEEIKKIQQSDLKAFEVAEKSRRGIIEESNQAIFKDQTEAGKELGKAITEPMTESKGEPKSNTEKVKNDVTSMQEMLPNQIQPKQVIDREEKTVDRNLIGDEDQKKQEEEINKRRAERDAKISQLGKDKESAIERGDKASAAMDTMMSKGQREGKSKEEIEGSEAYKNANKEMKEAYREAENISKEMGKAIFSPLTDAKEEVKSNSEKIKEDMKEALPVQGMRDKTEEMNKLAERRTEIEERLLERQGEVDGLKALASERALTEEEQAQLKLAENGVIRAQNNLKSNLEQQKELDEALGIAKKESDNKILEQTEKANKAQLESVGGMTDAAINAQDTFMQQINTLFDMPSEAAAEAQDAFMQEATALFDMPERDEFEEDEYGQGGEDVVLPEEPEKDYISLAMKDFADQVQGLTDSQMLEANEAQQGEGSMDSAFAEDEYGQGGEDVVLPEEPEKDYISLAMKDFADQIIGLKEFEEDEYGQGGDAIGGKMDPAFAEDEDDYVSQALKDFSSQLPETMNPMADDAAFAAGPGDASVAGIDYAEPPPPQQESRTGDANVAEAMASLQKTLPQANPSAKSEPSSKPQYSKIDMGMFTLGSDGMPVPKAKVQGQTHASGAQAEREKTKQEDKKATQATVRAVDNKIDKDQGKKSESGSTTPGKQTKTLDDVVKSLDQLNMNIGRLTNKVEESSRQQIQATKNLNGNLFNV